MLALFVLLYRRILQAVLTRGHAHLLVKRAIEGARGIKADKLADLGDRAVALAQVLTSVRNAQGIDVFVKADMELRAHHMRDIILTDVQLALEHGQRKILFGVRDAIIENRSEHVIVAGRYVGQLYPTEQQSEKAQKIAVQDHVLIVVIAVVNVGDAFDQRAKRGIVRRADQKIGGRNGGGEGRGVLGDHIGVEFEQDILLALDRFKAVDLIREDDDNVARIEVVDVVVDPNARFSRLDKGKLDLQMQMGRVTERFIASPRVATVKIVGSFFVDHSHTRMPSFCLSAPIVAQKMSFFKRKYACSDNFFHIFKRA